MAMPVRRKMILFAGAAHIGSFHVTCFAASIGLANNWGGVPAELGYSASHLEHQRRWALMYPRIAND